MVDMTYDYHKQCLTCNLSEHLREIVDKWAGTYEGLKRELFDNHSIAISADALSNHIRFHANQQQVNLEEDSGSQEGIVDIDGVRYFKRLKKQWQLNTGEWRRSYEFVPVETEEKTIEFKSLIDHLEKAEERFDSSVDFTPMIPKKRYCVVQFADLQTGKVDSRGDSEALVERVAKFKEKMKDYITDSHASWGVFGDLGDVIENYDNTGSQAFTNDLSLMEQIELATLLEQDLIFTMSDLLEHVDVAGVPSNHGAWRRGKDYLGRPGDDWGLFILKQIERVAGMSDSLKNKLTFHYPGIHEKSLSLDLGSEVIGMTHGDECSQDQTPVWWAKQVHGGSPLSDATMLLTGHYHNFRLSNSGRKADGKMKWWLSGNSMDNGSAWWANKSGHDSSPGVTVFLVDEDKGFDLGSLEVL